MLSQDSLLATLVKLVDRLPMPIPPQKRGQGLPIVYPDRVFLKALANMIVRYLHTVPELLSFLVQTNQRDAHSTAPVDAAGGLPISANLGAPLESAPGKLAGSGWLLRPSSGPPDPQRLVGCQVRCAGGQPFPDGLVRAFHVEDRDRLLLGEDITDAEGRYIIRYDMLPGVDSIDLRVVVRNTESNPLQSDEARFPRRFRADVAGSFNSAPARALRRP